MAVTRAVLIVIAVGAFAALGLEAMMGGDYRVGIASMCLALANGLLLQ